MRNQLTRDRACKGFVRSRAAVARITQHTHLVLDLNHDHRVIVAIECVQMAHQGSECLRIGVAACR